MIKVAIICAIPQESRPILRRLGFLSRVRSDELTLWSGTTADMQVTLAESGIGITRAAAAAKTIIQYAAPDIIISAGFCGAVNPGLHRGDIVFAEKIFTLTAGLQPSKATIDSDFLKLSDAAGRPDFLRGTFITTAAMVAKTWFAPLVDDRISNPVLEMESHAVAEVCQDNGIRFAGLRAVSDTAANDPQPVCSKLFDHEMKLSMVKLLLTVATSPLSVRRLFRLYVDTAAAGGSLAEAIKFSLGTLR